MSSDNKKIRFPEKSYVGMIGREEDGQPLGFLTEWGTDKAAEKRMATVDDWVARESRGWRATNKENVVFPARVYDNKPMAGFRVGREVRRYAHYGSGNVVWRIEDPRGFDLEISSPNMAQIMLDCVLDGGEILDQCIWARDGGTNVLVPVSTDLYKTATANSERIKKSVKPSDVKIGNRVVLQNGMEGIYLGKMFHLKRNYDVPYWTNTESSSRYYWTHRFESLTPWVWEDRSKHTFLALQEDEWGDRTFTYASLKVAEILDESTMDPAEIERMLSEKGHPVVYDRAEIGPIQTREVDFDTAIKEPFLLLRMFEFKVGLFRIHESMLKPQTYHPNDPWTVEVIYVDKTATLAGRPTYLTRVEERQQSGWGNYGNRTYKETVADQETMTFDKDVWRNWTYEQVYREITTKLGNTLRIVI